MAIVGIVAGGKGSRMGADMPKQFLDLCGEPVIIHTIKRFVSNENISSIIVGINLDWYDYMDKLNNQYFGGRIHLTRGGSDRNGTISNIIKYARDRLNVGEDEILITHDAVRPFVNQRMIDESIAAMEYCDICTAALPAIDTIVMSEDRTTVSEFPSRENIFRVQTPQTFRLGSFMCMLRSVTPQERQKITDACKLFYINKKKVYLIKGEEMNIKLTYPSDFEMAKVFLHHNA